MTAVPSQNPAKTTPATGFWLLPVPLRNFVRSRETGLVLVSIVIVYALVLVKHAG